MTMAPISSFWVEVLKPPPAAELSLIIGDCLHNLRAALDNLAFELALAHKRGRLSKGVEGDSAFPIFKSDIAKDPESLKKFNRMTRGIAPKAKAEIERLQPYNRGQRFVTNDVLWQLNELAVEDKHRLPHVVSHVSLNALSFFVPGGPGALEIEPITFAIEDRAPVARYPATDETGAEVDVQLTPSFDIGFGQRAPKQLRGMSVPNALERIHKHTTGKVLPPLKDFLT